MNNSWRKEQNGYHVTSCMILGSPDDSLRVYDDEKVYFGLPRISENMLE